jgi:geranylgeranyl diphosphate synthase type II
MSAQFEERTDNLVNEVMNEYGCITRREVERYIPQGAPQRHLYDPIADYPRRGGKMMRPSICIANARAFGADLEDALSSAVAIELLHNALLIHDDIQDESEERRGIPTLHKLYGVPLAINAGDTLAMLSLRPLIDNVLTIGPRISSAIMEEAQHMALASAEGQAMELGWIRDHSLDLGDEDYLEMVLKKTCWFATIFPSLVGALIGTRQSEGREQLLKFGFFLGAAFQIQDDVMNLLADARYGKEIDGDIYEGKRTIMLLHVFRCASFEEKQLLTDIMALPREQRDADKVNFVRGLMDRYGSIPYAKAIAHGLAGAALHEYSGIYGNLPASRDKEFIRRLVTWVFERTS